MCFPYRTLIPKLTVPGLGYIGIVNRETKAKDVASNKLNFDGILSYLKKSKR